MKFKENFILAPEKVDEIVAKVREYLHTQKVLKTDVNKAALLTDNILLNWLEQMPAGTQVCIDCYVRFRQPSIVLTCDGEKCNPLQDREEEFSEWLLGNLALSTQFVFGDHCNTVTIKLPRLQYSNSAKLLLGACAGLVVGFIMLFFMDPATIDVLSKGIFKPALDKIVKLLGTVASFMIFFSIVSGISNMDNINSFSKAGKQIVSVYFLLGSTGVILTNLLGCFWFRVVTVENSSFDIRVITDIFGRFLDFIPGNLIEPFVVGNNLQIIIIAIVSGVIIIILNNKVESLKKLVEDINVFFQTLLMHFADFLPVLVFLSVLFVCITSDYKTLTSALNILVAYHLIAGLILICFSWWVVRQCHLNLKHYLSAIFLPFFNAFMTTSSSSTLPIMQSTLEKKFGMNSRFSNVVLSFGLILGHLGGGIYLAMVTLGVISAFDISISFSQLITLVICEIIFGFSIPPVSGGSLALVFMLMHQLNAPVESTVLCLTAEFSCDFLATACDVLNIINGVLLCGYKMDANGVKEAA